MAQSCFYYGEWKQWCNYHWLFIKFRAMDMVAKIAVLSCLLTRMHPNDTEQWHLAHTYLI